MATLISLEDIEIKDNNDIQHAVTRLIYRKESFTRSEITHDIKEYLISRVVKSSIINSFFLNEMIIYTLEILVDEDEFLLHGDYYVRNPNKIPTYKGPNPNNRFEGEVIGLIPLEDIDLKDENNLQHVVTRIIYKKSEFTWIELYEEIKEFLKSRGVREATINSFKLRNMIMDTIELLEENREFLNYNNVYIRNKEKLPIYDKPIDNLVERQGDYCKIKTIRVSVE